VTTPSDPQERDAHAAVTTEPSVAAPTPSNPSPSDPPLGRRGRLTRGTRLIGAAVAAVVIGLVVWLVWPNSSPAPTHVVTAPISPNAVTTVGGQALLNTIRTGQGTTYHATYKVVGDAKVIGGTLSLEVWQAPPQAREDTVLVQNGVTSHTESFTSPTSGHLCTQMNTKPWSCHAVAATQAASGGAGGMISSISDEISGHGVAMHKQTIDGRAVTCFTVQVGANPELCADTNGVPVLIADSDVRYELSTLSESVSASAFSLPTQT
jgi:hypothetical protein